MTLEFRSPTEEDLRATLAAAETAFGEELRDDDYDRERGSIALDRFVAAYDAGRPVGVAGSYSFELTIPGGTVPAAGVTWVGVLPSHRRRGVLREFMRRQLEEVRDRDEPLAILWASEAPIYGRFGYGIAAPSSALDADRDRLDFRDDPGPQGTVRLVAQGEARELYKPIYERIRHERAGMLARTDQWWDAHRLADPEHWRDGAGPKLYALLELDGAPEGYAIYRVASKWEGGFPAGEVRITEALATTTEATRELWRFLTGIDLVTRVKQWIFDPASPLFLMVADPRRLRLRLSDGLWLRLVDVDAALRARSYADEGAVVLEVGDELCSWNDGRYRAGERPGRTDEEPELRLAVADLGSAYLGAFDFARLAAAGRVEELREGALDRASRLFHTPLPPFCPEVF